MSGPEPADDLHPSPMESPTMTNDQPAPTWICRLCDPTGTDFLDGGQDQWYLHYAAEHYREEPRPIPALRAPPPGLAAGSGGRLRAALLAERERLT